MVDRPVVQRRCRSRRHGGCTDTRGFQGLGIRAHLEVLCGWRVQSAPYLGPHRVRCRPQPGVARRLPPRALDRGVERLLRRGALRLQMHVRKVFTMAGSRANERTRSCSEAETARMADSTRSSGTPRASAIAGNLSDTDRASSACHSRRLSMRHASSVTRCSAMSDACCCPYGSFRVLGPGAHLKRAQQQVRKQHGAAGGVQQEALHQPAPVLPQLLHQLRQEERHLRGGTRGCDSAQHSSPCHLQHLVRAWR